MKCGSICSQNCQDYCFIVIDNFLFLTTSQAKNKAIALAITLVRTSEELTLYQFVMQFIDVFFMIARCDAARNYMFLRDSQLV